MLAVSTPMQTGFHFGVICSLEEVAAGLPRNVVWLQCDDIGNAYGVAMETWVIH